MVNISVSGGDFFDDAYCSAVCSLEPFPCGAPRFASGDALLVRLTRVDILVFDANERGPDDLLRYQFETVSRLSEHEQELVRELLDAVIIKNQVTGAIARVNAPAVSEKDAAKKRG